MSRAVGVVIVVSAAPLSAGEGEDFLTLRPVKQEPSMIRVNGFWVHQGVAPGGFDWTRHIDEELELRARQVSRV